MKYQIAKRFKKDLDKINDQSFMQVSNYTYP